MSLIVVGRTFEYKIDLKTNFWFRLVVALKSVICS